MEKLINYLNKLWSDTISPTIKNSWNKSKENSDRIIAAINNKKYGVNKPSEISDPIVEAQNATTEAVKAIPRVEIPETDLKPLEMKLEALLEALNNKEMSVKIGKTQVDTKSVVKAIEKLQESMPKMEKQEVIDYTVMLDEMMKILERPKDHSEMIKLQGLVKRLGTSNDLGVIADWLRVISEKEYPELPGFKFNKYGRLEVEVDRAGGGGGLTDIETDALTGINTNQIDGSQKTQIVDGDGDIADIIQTNGNNGLVTFSPGHISTDNSTNTPLSADAIFTGEWEEITNFGIIVITLKASHASATDGLEVDFSSDGTNIDSCDQFTVPADTGKTFSFQAATQYFRVKYTNGGTNQTYFRLQTTLKPYYVKPSSHRINDAIVGEDDAELVKAVSTGLAPDGAFKNVLVTNTGNQKISIEELESGVSVNSNTQLRITPFNSSGVEGVKLIDKNGNPIESSLKADGTYALDVFNSDIKENLINQSFIQRTANTTTIASSASAEDTQITVVDGSSFLVGDTLIIEQGLSLLDNYFTVTAKPSANVITLDMPIDLDLDDTAVVTEILADSNVNGSLASPQVFVVKPPSDEVWHLTRLLFTMTDQTAMDDSLFGGLTALTNGLVIRKKVNGVFTTLANFKYNGRFADSMYDIAYADKAPAGFYGLRGRWTIEKSGSIIRLDGANGDELELLVQDNLTGLDTLHWTAQGHKESE